MNIDYEAIATGAPKVAGWTPNAEWVKAIIEAYEAQKAKPEWVPLDLATVKQGQEVRSVQWGSHAMSDIFVCVYKDSFISETAGGGLKLRDAVDNWLMRAPKPKTVRVRVFKTGAGVYEATTGDVNRLGLVGEGDIEVRG